MKAHAPRVRPIRQGIAVVIGLLAAAGATLSVLVARTDHWLVHEPHARGIWDRGGIWRCARVLSSGYVHLGELPVAALVGWIFPVVGVLAFVASRRGRLDRGSSPVASMILITLLGFTATSIPVLRAFGALHAVCIPYLLVLVIDILVVGAAALGLARSGVQPVRAVWKEIRIWLRNFDWAFLFLWAVLIPALFTWMLWPRHGLGP